MAKKKSGREKQYRPGTALVLAGRSPFEHDGFVNTPIYRGSTVLWETYDDLIEHRGRYTYGRRGTPTTDALTDALRAFEGSAGVMLTPSGLVGNYHGAAGRGEIRRSCPDHRFNLPADTRLRG